MASETFDFVIVGGGLSGLVLASRLSENRDTTVLVIESGKDLRDDPRVKIPAMWAMLLDDPDATWQLKTVPQVALGGREINFSQGRTVGGSSALNGLSFSATSKANVDAWESLGNTGWGWDDFTASMDKSYKNGPLQLAVPDEDTKWPQVWRDTLSNLGFCTSNEAFSGHVSGALTVPDTISASKERSFSGNAYFGSANDRPNVTIWTQTTVRKILFEDPDNGPPSDPTIATGVEYTTVDGQTKTVKAAMEVVLTAGSINSPRILELSGVGDKTRLEKLGIKVHIDNPFVGENLQNHPMCGVNFEVLGGEEGFETMDKIARQDAEAVAAAMDDYTKRHRGPFFRSGANYVAHLPFPGIGDTTGTENLNKILQIPVPGDSSKNTALPFAKAHESFVHSVLKSPSEASGCYLSAAAFAGFNPDGSKAPVTQFPGDKSYFTIVLLLAHPLSRGSVHIKSATPSVSPAHLAVDPAYLTHPLDIEVLASHLQYAAATIAATEPLASHLKPDGEHNPGGPDVGSFRDLDNVRKYVRETVVGAQHWTGTCSMMSRDMGGVVDPKLRLYGCRNLRVCDASVIPITPRTNPQATVYGIAERAADIIKAEYSVDE